jgi:murein DD-endopeptidase MepM/ murein hydrolase activator NlpD
LQACSLDPSLFDEELKDVTEIRQTQKFLNEFDTTVVKSGDTLFGIARRFGVSVQTIVEINNLGLNNVIFKGQVLKIPKNSGSNSVTLNSNKNLKIVTLPQPKPDFLKTSSRILKVKFYSPLDGEIITKFGIKSDGVMNEGIYIEADYGTIVKSSADGEVIFVGSDLKDFGKLLIVKHSENLITSYAHLSKIYVHEGEIITRGQPIAEVGSSGKVTKSQLYFEIRQDNEALDPITYLDS